MFCNLLLLKLMWLRYHDPFIAQCKQTTGQKSALCTGLHVTRFRYNLFKCFDGVVSSSSVESASHGSAN